MYSLCTRTDIDLSAAVNGFVGKEGFMEEEYLNYYTNEREEVLLLQEVVHIALAVATQSDELPLWRLRAIVMEMRTVLLWSVCG